MGGSTRPTVGTLILYKLRLLAHNRPACLVLLGILASAVAIRLSCTQADLPAIDTCYVVYWEQNSWIRHLEKAANEALLEHNLRTEVVPVEQVTPDDSVIRYPHGVNSIQIPPLRQHATEPDGWFVWYWYAGSDPARLLPCMI